MIVSIASLKAAGLTAEQIVAVVDAAEAERLAKVREQNRIRKRNQRARHDVTRDRVTDDVTQKTVTTGKAEPGQQSCNAVTRDMLTTTLPPASPSPMVSPNTPSLTSPPSPTHDATARAREARVVTLASRGARLAPDWQPSSADLAFAASIGMRLYQVDSEAEKFRDYWHAKAGANATKVDWPATWRNWCRKATEHKGNGNGARLSVVDAGERLIAAEKARVGDGPGPLLDLTPASSATSDQAARPLPKR